MPGKLDYLCFAQFGSGWGEWQLCEMFLQVVTITVVIISYAPSWPTAAEGREDVLDAKIDVDWVPRMAEYLSTHSNSSELHFCTDFFSEPTFGHLLSSLHKGPDTDLGVC